MRGSGKSNLYAKYCEALLEEYRFTKFALVGDSLTFNAYHDTVEQPYVRPELTDYDPRGADRIKGPKGPRTKWGKIK